jgi:hypothetical protein
MQVGCHLLKRVPENNHIKTIANIIININFVVLYEPSVFFNVVIIKELNYCQNLICSGAFLTDKNI